MLLGMCLLSRADSCNASAMSDHFTLNSAVIRLDHENVLAGAGLDDGCSGAGDNCRRTPAHRRSRTGPPSGCARGEPINVAVRGPVPCWGVPISGAEMTVRPGATPPPRCWAAVEPARAPTASDWKFSSVGTGVLLRQQHAS
jgi:hypothetical protein